MASARKDPVSFLLISNSDACDVLCSRDVRVSVEWLLVDIIGSSMYQSNLMHASLSHLAYDSVIFLFCMIGTSSRRLQYFLGLIVCVRFSEVLCGNETPKP